MTEQVLGGRYEIEDRLGAGGMATVYRGTDRELDRSVAVKILHERYTEDPQFVARFRREARAAAALNHPNVVSIYDTGSTDGTRYIVMEYVEGRTLRELLAEEGPLPAERAVDIAEAICLGLRSAHDKGLVHRDIKPGNVMLTDDGRVKVMDFGIARAATSETLTQTAIVMGTAAYLSPEQAEGKKADARSDIYALGCVLYEMVVGRPPFTGDSAVVLAGRHVRETPEPPSRHRPEIPPALEAVILRALSKDPGKRQQTAEELREALRGAVGESTEPVSRPEDTAILAEPITGAVPFWKRAGTRPWLIAAGIAALLAIVAAALLLGGGEPRVTREQRQALRDRAEEQAPPQEPEPSPIEAAYFRLAREVNNGVASEDIPPDVGGKVLEQANKAVAEPEKAGEELGKAHEELSKAEAEGAVVDPNRAEDIHAAIDELAAAMGVEVILEEEGGEGEGEEDSSGSGKGGEPPGEAKGHDKD